MKSGTMKQREILFNTGGMDWVENGGALVQVGLEGVGLGEIVGEVVSARGPVDAVLLLLDAISDPEVSYVYGFGSLNVDGLVRNTLGSGVVGDDGSGILWVAEVGEGGT